MSASVRHDCHARCQCRCLTGRCDGYDAPLSPLQTLSVALRRLAGHDEPASQKPARTQQQCAPCCQVAEAEAAAAASHEEAASSRDAVRSAEAARDAAVAEAAATADALRAAEDRLAEGASQVAQLESQLAEARALQQVGGCTISPHMAWLH